MLVEKARLAYKAVKSLEDFNRGIYWHRAEALWKLKKDDLYQYVFGDDGLNSWKAFCQGANIVPATASEKVKNYEFYIVKLGFSIKELTGLDGGCLYYLHRKYPEMERKEVEGWIVKLKSLSRNDFMEEIRCL